MFVESRKLEGVSAKRKMATEMRRFTAGDEGWFDGSPQSVDKRLAQANRVLQAAQATVARNPFDWHAHDLITQITADRNALIALREDLLTGAAGREAPRKKAPEILLTASERKWVELEVPKFLRANRDCLTDAQGHLELAERAQNHAALVTSRLPRSREMTASFVETVAYEARQIPFPKPKRVASRDVREIDGAAMFL
jgi:hypothetical protein